MFYDDAFKTILETSPFSQTVKVNVSVNGVISEYTLSGFFYSGTYSEESPARAYSPKKGVRGDTFEISLLSVPSDITDPIRDFRGATLTGDMGIYKVYEVRGERSGVLTFKLNPMEASS